MAGKRPDSLEHPIETSSLGVSGFDDDRGCSGRVNSTRPEEREVSGPFARVDTFIDVCREDYGAIRDGCEECGAIDDEECGEIDDSDEECGRIDCGCEECRDDDSDDSRLSWDEDFCEFIQEQQAANADPRETVERILSHTENDCYGYSHGLEESLLKVLDRAELEALESAVCERASHADEASYAYLRKVEILKAIHAERRDVAAYIALCDAEDGLAPRDCEVLAEVSLERGRPDDALEWAERGLGLEEEKRWPAHRSSRRLPHLRRDVLMRLGQNVDALARAWACFRRAPSVGSYDELMRLVPPGERKAWEAKALAAFRSADLSSWIDDLVRTKDRERLARVIDAASREKLAELGRPTAERAARVLLLDSHPFLAVKIHVAMTLRTIDLMAAKRRMGYLDYRAALASLGRVRRVLLREWTRGDARRGTVREERPLKSGSSPGVEPRVEGRTSRREPSSRERARRRGAGPAGQPRRRRDHERRKNPVGG